MADNKWLSRAKARAQVDTVTPANVGIGNTFTYTINGKSVTVTATAGTVANVTGLAATALEASEDAEFTELTFTDSTTHVTVTGPAGVPFTLTASASGGTATNTQATTTTATGPNHYNDANNWSLAATPIATNRSIIDLSLGSILYGLSNAGATLANTLIFSPTRTTNRIGLPKINANGYTEYRQRSLAIDSTLCTIECECESIDLDFGTVQNTTEIRLASLETQTGAPAVLIQGTNVANAIDVQIGSVGLAFYDGDAYNGSLAKCGPAASLIGGLGAEVDEVESLGSLVWSGPFGDITAAGGIADLRGTQVGGTVTGQDAAQVLVNFSGTITDALIGCPFDASADRSARTFQNTTIDPGGSLNDPNQTIAHSSGVELGLQVTSLQAA